MLRLTKYVNWKNLCLAYVIEIIWIHMFYSIYMYICIQLPSFFNLLFVLILNAFLVEVSTFQAAMRCRCDKVD